MMIENNPATKVIQRGSAVELAATKVIQGSPELQLAATKVIQESPALQSATKDLPSIDIGKIVIGIVEETKEDFLKNPEVQKFEKNMEMINNSVQNLDIDRTIEGVSDVVSEAVINTREAFLKLIMSNINKKIEENKIKISEKLRFHGKTQEEIDNIFNILQELSDFTDLFNLDLFNIKLLDLKKIIEKIILQKLKLIGITTEEEISKVLKNLIQNLIGESINDVASSLPITIAQALASIWPLGSEPLVAVNKLNDIITQFIQILIDIIMNGIIEAIEKKLIQGGKRKHKRKSKSKHFYINRIRRTLKHFYNY